MRRDLAPLLARRTFLQAGGGTRGGNLVGASDHTCAFPVELPVSPSDVVATIYHALGLGTGKGDITDIDRRGVSR